MFKKKSIFLYIFYKKNNYDYISEIREFKGLIIANNYKLDCLLKVNVRIPNRKYFIGLGKLKYLKEKVKTYKFYYIVINKSLKFSQEKNLESFLCCKIINKTSLILSIFKKRAVTFWGKLQVELARLIYLSTRLTHKWKHLERQRGGNKYISGPGEKQIEIDRRLIKIKIKNIKQKLSLISKQRENSNNLRIKNNIPTLSLVGYTNSGKSTLFNLLTKSCFSIKNIFFSTLDTYIKKIKILNLKDKVLLSDTIGFIRDLPSNLKEAFKSTLDEIYNSRLILHVIDVSNIFFKDYIYSVNLILESMNINIPIIQIMNKIDQVKNCYSKVEFNNNNFPFRIWISAKYSFGITKLCSVIEKFLFLNKKDYVFYLPLKIYLLVYPFFCKFNFIKKACSVNGMDYYLIITSSKTDFSFILRKFSFLKNYIHRK